MRYYDSDCFWTHEELGRQQVEELQPKGFINECIHWCKELLDYVVDWEDTIVNEVNNKSSAQLQDRNVDYRSNQDGYRAKSNGQENI